MAHKREAMPGSWPQRAARAQASRHQGARGAARRARPLTGLLALLCPLLCLGPIALASIAGTGMVRSLGGAPWALGAASIAAAVALCARGMRPGHAQRRHDGESVPCPWASE